MKTLQKDMCPEGREPSCAPEGVGSPGFYDPLTLGSVKWGLLFPCCSGIAITGS